jgi:hypothetical protein
LGERCTSAEKQLSFERAPSRLDLDLLAVPAFLQGIITLVLDLYCLNRLHLCSTTAHLACSKETSGTDFRISIGGLDSARWRGSQGALASASALCCSWQLASHYTTTATGSTAVGQRAHLPRPRPLRPALPSKMTPRLPPISSSSRSSSPAPRGEDLVFVHTSTTSTSPIPSRSSKSSSGSFGSSRGRPHLKSSSSSRSDTNRAFDEWLAAYSSNKLGLRPDQVPPPPPAILAILEEEKATRSSSPASNDSGDVMFIYSNRSAHSFDSIHSEEPPSALDQFRSRGHLQAPRAPFEQERLKLASKFGLEQPRRRAALDAICKLAKRHFSMKTVSPLRHGFRSPAACSF